MNIKLINFLIINNKNKEQKKNENYLKSDIDSQIKIEDFKLNPLNKDIIKK